VAELPSGRYGIKYTTGSQYDVDLADVTLGSGETLNASIPASGAITVYGKYVSYMVRQSARLY
jgi:hypothetical protein